jgi:hypothetical protein
MPGKISADNELTCSLVEILAGNQLTCSLYLRAKAESHHVDDFDEKPLSLFPPDSLSHPGVPAYKISRIYTILFQAFNFFTLHDIEE